MREPENETAWLRGANQIAKHCGVSSRTIHKWIDQGLPVNRISIRLMLAKRDEVDAWIVKRGQEMEAERKGNRS